MKEDPQWADVGVMKVELEWIQRSVQDEEDDQGEEKAHTSQPLVKIELAFRVSVAAAIHVFQEGCKRSFCFLLLRRELVHRGMKGAKVAAGLDDQPHAFLNEIADGGNLPIVFVETFLRCLTTTLSHGLNIV